MKMSLDLAMAVKSGNEDVITSLPPELLIEIVAQFPVAEITRLCRVSKHVNELVCQNQDLWRMLFRRDISSREIPKNEDYHNAYMQARQLELRLRNVCQRMHWWSSEETEIFMRFIQRGYDKLIHQIITRCYQQNPKWVLSQQHELNTFIEFAIRRNYPEILQDLLNLYFNGIKLDNANYRDNNGRPIAPSAIVKMRRFDLIDALLNQGFQPDDFINYAARYGQIDTLEFLAQRGANLRTRAKEILEIAADTDNIKLGHFALNLGPNNIKKAIDIAAEFENWDFVREFAPLVPPEDLNFALRKAVEEGTNGNIDIIKFILDLVNPQSIPPPFQQGIARALRSAARRDNSDVVKLLLPYTQPNHLQAAFRAAYCNKHYGLAQLLEQAGVPIYPTGTGGNVEEEDEEEGTEDEDEEED